jgi:hypothetical protein
MESASAGSGERAGDGPFALTHLLYRPSYGSPARRAAAPRNEQSARLFELVRGDDSGRGRVRLRGGLDFAAPNARPWTCFDALYEPKRIAWSEPPVPAWWGGVGPTRWGGDVDESLAPTRNSLRARQHVGRRFATPSRRDAGGKHDAVRPPVLTLLAARCAGAPGRPAWRVAPAITPSCPAAGRYVADLASEAAHSGHPGDVPRASHRGGRIRGQTGGMRREGWPRWSLAPSKRRS